MKNTLTCSDFDKIIEVVAKSIEKNSTNLCKLDSVVGDGDQGSTIMRGFKAAVKAKDDERPATIDSLLILVGNSMIESMGGASGPICGSLFKEMGKAARGKEVVRVNDLVEMLMS